MVFPLFANDLFLLRFMIFRVDIEERRDDQYYR